MGGRWAFSLGWKLATACDGCVLIPTTTVKRYRQIVNLVTGRGMRARERDSEKKKKKNVRLGEEGGVLPSFNIWAGRVRYDGQARPDRGLDWLRLPGLHRWFQRSSGGCTLDPACKAGPQALHWCIYRHQCTPKYIKRRRRHSGAIEQAQVPLNETFGIPCVYRWPNRCTPKIRYKIKHFALSGFDVK